MENSDLVQYAILKGTDEFGWFPETFKGYVKTFEAYKMPSVFTVTNNAENLSTVCESNQSVKILGTDDEQEISQEKTEVE